MRTFDVVFIPIFGTHTPSPHLGQTHSQFGPFSFLATSNIHRSIIKTYKSANCHPDPQKFANVDVAKIHIFRA